MSDLTDLPLFGGGPMAESSLKRRRRGRDPDAEATSIGVEPSAAPPNGSAVLLAFPPSRNTRLVADLARVFVGLRERHGRRCRAMLLTRRFPPISANLREMGMSAALVDRELAQLEAAVARSVWIADGRPSYGVGGGSAA